MLGVQPAFLRRLESEALIQPARSDGRQRRYTQLEIRDIERIVALVNEGMTLVGIRRIMALEDEVQALQQHIDELGAAEIESPGGQDDFEESTD
jgi:MerR family transcriptional regulator/heat shock protein HspR